MKKIIFLTLIVIGMPLIAGATEDHSKSSSDILAEILESQGISQASNVDCQKVTDEQFEELGDAVMEQRHPGEQHVMMDQMMGGEGSDTLRSMHIAMGQNYLGCGSDKNFFNSGMMGSGMMNGLMSNSFGMMGSFGLPFFSFSYFITIILVWALLILGIIVLIKLIKK